ncbi:hypothetical protein [Candidatus Uabimicrobium amorphum]|uniref:Uncharacterized protein n=1 Tax=Uabimicrobium amorphum TaxID=2596890 RepID=A0A5S9IQL1_UABAM|nr:hypothetical protein [Candidatus Uabimicrobium amorphum]BBM85761.1 hypothetical protein UABAM_04139 [Candidatus Uabimicrobium amorphum]
MIRLLTIVLLLHFVHADTTRFHIRSVINVTNNSVVQNIYFSKEVYDNIVYGKRKNYTNYTQFSQFCANLNSIFINDTPLKIRHLEYESHNLYTKAVIKYNTSTIAQKIKVLWHIFPDDILPTKRNKWQLSQFELSKDMLQNWSKKSPANTEVYVVLQVLHAPPYEENLTKRKKTFIYHPKYKQKPQKIKVVTQQIFHSVPVKWCVFTLFLLLAISLRHRLFYLITIGIFILCLSSWSWYKIPLRSYTVEKPTTTKFKKQTFRALLYNIYNSFAYDDKHDVYDALHFSTGGDMLEEIYLEAHRSLFRDPQNTFLIHNVAIHDDFVIELDRNSFQIKAKWQVTGWAIHMGHKHLRTNEYEAVYTIKNMNGFWKIAKCTVLRQIRLA